VAFSRLDHEAVLPDENAGTSRRPSQRSARFVSTARTVGLNAVARAPGGWICTSSFAPSRSSPLIRRMKGFHFGVGAKIGQDRPHTLGAWRSWCGANLPATNGSE
jgi:hypothetical protein